MWRKTRRKKQRVKKRAPLKGSVVCVAAGWRLYVLLGVFTIWGCLLLVFHSYSRSSIPIQLIPIFHSLDRISFYFLWNEWANLRIAQLNQIKFLLKGGGEGDENMRVFLIGLWTLLFVVSLPTTEAYNSSECRPLSVFITFAVLHILFASRTSCFVMCCLVVDSHQCKTL